MSQGAGRVGLFDVSSVSVTLLGSCFADQRRCPKHHGNAVSHNILEFCAEFPREGLNWVPVWTLRLA